MQNVNMFEAKTNLSKLVEAIESGREDEIVIARNGRPVARLARLKEKPVGQRLGVARGKFVLPDSFDADNEAISKLFGGQSA
jgi:antitoxin (DNA-binding transcriptional repressor) of toxin-antitoxin stability system